MKADLKHIKNIQYFTKGHRGILYTGEYKKSRVVIKTERKDTGAVCRIKNEIESLKKLNEIGIGPKLLFYDRSRFQYFVYPYIDGSFFPSFIEHSGRKNKSQIMKIIKSVFLQCFRMDKMKIDKEEMHHPFKHIIIEKSAKKPVLIDFERCHKTAEPKNTTQFSSYIISQFISNMLKERGIRVNEKKMIIAAKGYKKDMKKINLERILNCIK